MLELTGNRTDFSWMVDAAARAVDMRQVRWRAYIVLYLLDVVAITAGFVLANMLRFGTAFHEQGLTLVAAVLPIYLVLNLRQFIPEMLVDWREGIGSSVMLLGLAIGIVLFVGFFLKASTELSRVLTVASFVLSAAAIVAGRAIFGQIWGPTFRGGALSQVLICDGVTAEAPPGVHRIDATAIELSSGVPHPIILDRLARAIDRADAVFIACLPERRADWSATMQGSTVRAELLIPELTSVGHVGGTFFAGTPTVKISSGALRVRDAMVKRMLDLALVIPTLVFLAPLMIMVAIAIKIDNRGPVFFVQQRVGQGNRLFQVFKFRSMRAEQSDQSGNRSASRTDDRITRVGRFIRATSIDELPQLLNILLGDMSFVGPRPHALGSLAGDSLFWEVDSRYHHRHVCKPGLTGLAQVRGFRGATGKREDLINRLHSDLEYVCDWTVWRDLQILFATVKVIVHRNAY